MKAEKKVPDPTPVEYTITMTEEEAVLLSKVLGTIGGCGVYRGVIDAVWDALEEVGVSYDVPLPKEMWEGGKYPYLSGLVE